MTVRRLTIRVHGRPAPQGSKDVTRRGHTIEQSVYLPAWRSAVKRDALGAMLRDAGRPPLPMFGPELAVVVDECTFIVTNEQCRTAGTDYPTGTPDIDKLLRATLDALGGSPKIGAKVFADDSQVVEVNNLRKVRATSANGPGALIIVRGIETA